MRPGGIARRSRRRSCRRRHAHRARSVGLLLAERGEPLAIAGVGAARIATGEQAALAAPASPIANVATGMPFGICTIDSSESSPRRYFDGTGTPSTGTVVFAASMPGRCAAPPAPAMMKRRPRGAGVLGIREHVVGHAVRRTTRVSYGDAERVELRTPRAA